jgi:hypothetical protein
MNGKGSKLRKGANLKAYRENYDRIFKKSDEKQLTEDKEQVSEKVDEDVH